MNDHSIKYDDLFTKDENFNHLILENTIDERIIVFLLRHHSKLTITSFQEKNDTIKDFINGTNGFGMIIKVEESTNKTNYISLLRIDGKGIECDKYKYVIFDSRRKEKLFMREDEISLIYEDVDTFMGKYDYKKLKETMNDDDKYNEKLRNMKLHYERIYRRLNGKKYLILKEKEEYIEPTTEQQNDKINS